MDRSTAHMPRTEVQKGLLWLVATLGLMLLVRGVIWLVYMDHETLFLQPDSHDYLYLGQQLFEHGGFPSLSRTPVYPLFLGFTQYVLGWGIHAIILLQIVLSLIVACLAWRVMMKCWPNGGHLTGNNQVRYGYVAFFFIFGLDFVSAQGANYVLSETLFSLLILFAINLAIDIKHQQRNGWLMSLLCGIVLGAAILCRPIAIFLPFVFLFWGMFGKNPEGQQGGGQPIRFQKMALFGLVFVIGLSFAAGWMARNQEKTGVAFLTTISSINLYDFRAAWNVAYRDGLPFEEVQKTFREYKAKIQQEQNLNDGQLSKVMAAEGLRIIKETPVETVYQGGLGFFRLYFGVFGAAIDDLFVVLGFPNGAIVLKLFALLQVVLIYLGVVGLLFFSVFKGSPVALSAGVSWDKDPWGAQKKSILIFCGLVIGYFTLLSVGIEAYGRFRIPMMPLLGILSALGWVGILTWVVNKGRDGHGWVGVRKQ